MGWMKQQRERQNRFAFGLHSKTGSPWTSRPSSTFYFNWRKANATLGKRGFMRNLKGSLLFIAAMTVLSFLVIAQDNPAPDSVSQVSTTPAATPQTNLAAPSSFDQ